MKRLTFIGALALGLFAGCSPGCSRGSDAPVRPDTEQPSAQESGRDDDPRDDEVASADASPDRDAEDAPGSPAGSEASQPEPRAEHLELTFVGDVIFGRYRPSGYDPIPEDGFEVFKPMAEALRSDVLVGNLETPLVRELPSDSPIGSQYRFGASLEQAKLLAEAGFTAMSLANNHWFDMRREGVEQTPVLLEEIGVVPIGGGVKDGDPFRVQTVTAKGWKIGFVSITTRTNSPMREQVPRIPYLRTREIEPRVAPLLRDAKEAHDLLVVLVHWGDERADGPNYAQVEAAHALVDAGANLVIGHHPHVLQGVERHGDGLIAYSLGNFLFENTSEPPRWTGVLRVRVTGSPPCVQRVVLHPAYVTRRPVPHPAPASGYTERRVKSRMRAVSERFDTKWLDEDRDLVLADTQCGL